MTGLHILVVRCPDCGQTIPAIDEDRLDILIAECENCGECFRVERLGGGKIRVEKIEVS